jgi:hypothetical protein
MVFFIIFWLWFVGALFFFLLSYVFDMMWTGESKTRWTKIILWPLYLIYRACGGKK